MAKGRKPTPSHLKLVTGNPGKRPLNEAEPAPRRERPSAPAHISDGAREAWGQAVMILDEMGVLTRADVFAVEALCEALADHRAAGSTIKECAAFHRFVKGEGGEPDFSADGRYYRTINQAGGVMWRTHPAVALRADADRRIKAWCSEFGMTPSARTRIQTTGQEDPGNAAAAYF
jgi:P27 family predicted phage terminase small subunit